MATTLVQVTAASNSAYRITNDDKTFPEPGQKNNNYAYNFNPGGTSGARVASKIFTRTYTIAGGATETIDLSGTTLRDAFGELIVFTKVKRIRVRHADLGTASTVLVDGGAANVANSLRAVIARGGWVDLVNPTVNGYALTPGTADLLVIVNQDGSNAATVEVEVLGE